MNTSRLPSGASLLLLASTLALVFLIPSPVAADSGRGGEAGVIGGVVFPSDNITPNDDPSWTLGARGGSIFGRYIGWYVDLLYSDLSTDTVLGEARTLTWRTGFEVLFQPERSNRFFFSLAAGQIDVDYKNADSFKRAIGSVSFGQRIALAGRTRVRWELRADRSLDDNTGPVGEDITQGFALVSFMWGPRIHLKDSDEDGVPDRRDDCPGTPRGAIVDERGCPMDSDGDGVYDGLDRCPDTPRGWPVDEYGCPLDSDGDGVPDGKDACPNTPAGALVDERGCPMDSDGDGVYDGLDKCPNTPAGAIVDADGCPLDSDGDGVYDGLDKCPNTPEGIAVGSDGCPLAAPLFVEEQKELVLEGVFFKLNSAELTLNSTEVLRQVADSLLAWPDVRMEIGGHTDSSGREQYNVELSYRRAASVRDYLISQGVPAGRLVVQGYGESDPIADNNTAEGRAKNRRVGLTRLD